MPSSRRSRALVVTHPSGSADPMSKEAWELAIAKLKTSGLDEEDFQKLGMSALSPAQTQACHPAFGPLCSLRIPYFDPRTGMPLSAHPKWPPFYRLRYLRPDGDQKGDTRYVNEPNAGAVAYFPRSVDWLEIMLDSDATLIITEGELKAAKACKEGHPCIGLGGVWNFRAAGNGVTFLPELEAVNWAKRRVYIVYDSDVMTKPDVRDALNALVEELVLRGALPFIVTIPEGSEGQKQGLDDWCVNNPDVSLYDLCARHQPLSQVRKLFDLNERLVYIMNKGIVVEQRTGTKHAVTQFKEAYQNIDYAEMILTDTSISLKKAPIALSWLKWPLRHQVADMTYQPGKPRLIPEPEPMYNLWPGWGVQPAEGDAQPFFDLVDHLFTGAGPQDKLWFYQWLAYPLQYPGTKLFSAVVIHGVRHGTGKSLIGYTMGKIYGKNFTEINQQSLHADFNGWAEAKQLVMGDDVTGSNKRQDNDVLKKLITQRELRVNTKFMPEYVVPDCVNYYFTSNHPDAFFLEDDDRRYFIHEVQVGNLPEDFYMEYGLWLDTTGPAAVFDWLLKLDTSKFNPSAPALRTLSKELMTVDGKSDLGTWVAKLRQDPDSVLRVGEALVLGDLFTNSDLLEIYDPLGVKKVTANGIGRELRRAAVPRAHRGMPIKGPKGIDRYYICRNPEKWIAASANEVVAQLVRQALGETRLKKF